MVRCDNLVYVDENEAFFLVHLDPEETEKLMAQLKELGIEGQPEVVYCG